MWAYGSDTIGEWQAISIGRVLRGDALMEEVGGALMWGTKVDGIDNGTVSNYMEELAPKTCLWAENLEREMWR